MDTLFGYPLVMVDNMPHDTVAMIEFGPPLWEVPVLPDTITVSDFQCNVLGQGKLKWRDYGHTWRAKVEWELPEKEEG